MIAMAMKFFNLCFILFLFQRLKYVHAHFFVMFGLRFSCNSWEDDAFFAALYQS